MTWDTRQGHGTLDRDMRCQIEIEEILVQKKVGCDRQDDNGIQKMLKIEMLLKNAIFLENNSCT